MRAARPVFTKQTETIRSSVKWSPPHTRADPRTTRNDFPVKLEGQIVSDDDDAAPTPTIFRMLDAVTHTRTKAPLQVMRIERSTIFFFSSFLQLFYSDNGQASNDFRTEPRLLTVSARTLLSVTSECSCCNLPQHPSPRNRNASEEHKFSRAENLGK